MSVRHPLPPGGRTSVRTLLLAWAMGGALAGGMASLFEWNFEPERLPAGASLLTYAAGRASGAMILALAGGLAAYAVARPVAPSEVIRVSVIPIVLASGWSSPARLPGRLLVLAVPLGLMYGAWVRASRGWKRADDGEEAGRAGA